ncbi:uncharacterized protein DUF4214 [Marinobacterium halophilum]|uniref:Uncharacterized protein DUF4214 n=1 Tax=Marinobacterium halophilum TaxID=267374 RepID=A0A2P8EXC0_9GAMM|nr:DUF4214 domain-containing protein [Marinobacterium halophilum]PSL14104.1 uncharacterized protein DUF4214 [Marinobacterium halophilum]
MAQVTATHWGLNFWEGQLETLHDGLDRVYDQFWEAADDVMFGTVRDASNTALSVDVWGGGTASVSGRNFYASNYGDIVVNRVVTQGTGREFTAAGDLRMGGELGVYGTLSQLDFGSVAGTISARGIINYGRDGSMQALNLTETLGLATGDSLISQTDGSGDYVRHQAQVDGHQLTIEGRWAYDTVDSWSELLGGEDVLQGSQGNDYLQGFAGNDRLEGGAGTDTAVFQGNRDEYQIQAQGEGAFLVTDNQTGRDGQDTLVNIQRLAFDDGMLARDSGSDGVAGQAYRLYQAAFDRTPDEAGLGYWVRQMDHGMNLQEAAARFIDSIEFKELYGFAPSNDDFLHRLYTNILDREPDASGYDWWLEQLNTNPEKTWDRVLADFSESPENLDNMLEITGGIISFDLF